MNVLKRFERFKKEIEYVNKLTDIEGIMLIEDCNLSSMDNSWYLMKKVREYKAVSYTHLDVYKRQHLQIVKIIKKKIFSKFNKRDRQNKNKKKNL